MPPTLLTHMVMLLSSASDWPLRSSAADKRRSPRLNIAFPTIIRGISTNGRPFEEQTVTDNLSAGGLYLRVAQPAEPGKPIFAISGLSTSPLYRGAAPRVALRGIVLRLNEEAPEQHGLAMRFTHQRLLSAQLV